MNSLPRLGRHDNLIDVNENLGLTSLSYNPTSYSPTRVVSELQEQLKSYKRELARKDELINELSTSPRITHIHHPPPVKLECPQYRTDTTFNSDSATVELAGAKIKIENLSAENHDLRSRMDLKDNHVRELKSRLEIAKENSAKQDVMLQSLRDRLFSAENQTGELEQVSTRGSATIQSLQKQNREAQDRIVELEARLRNHVLNKEESEQSAETSQRSFHDAVARMGDAINVDTEGGHMDGAVEAIVEKAKAMCQDNLLLQSKLQTMEDALNAHTLETKASRETIMRLVSEVGKEQKSVSENTNQLTKLQRDLDDANYSKEGLERENEMLKERIAANDKTWASSRDELSQTNTKITMLTDDVKRLEYERNLANNEFQTFRSSMAKILSDPYVEVEPREDAIKDRIKEMVSSEHEKKAHIDVLEQKVSDMNKELERQCELHHETVRRAKKAETFTYQNENRLRDLEGELASTEVLRDTLRNEKNRYLKFLEQMAQAMHMEDVAVDLGYDLNTDVLIARAHQLQRLESEAVVEKTSNNHVLRRKVKELKEQVKSKELHMELLRKKIAQQDEREQTRSGLALDRDDAIVTVQKLQRKVERLQHALGDERVKVTQLKAQLAETNELKAVTLEQRRRIDELVTSVGKLSTTKDRQRQKLSSLKQNLKMTGEDANLNHERLRTQLDAVTNDNKSTKTALDEVTRREKQLVDFREVVARMLGLDVTSLAIPDYEIISRLEKLIRNHHIGTAATATLERSFEALDPRFRQGYTEVDYTRSRSPHYENRARSPSPRRHHHRSRSPSPRRY
nr:coiled-coil domain-containing protein 170 [Ciona intestinalis]|eukprot:XP_009861725.1 coiled-coil domain-containing protein 170 [Ciona intestinalis]